MKVLEIKDLIELGKWLNENSLDSFGREIRDKDIIFHINYDSSEFKIDNLYKKSDFDYKSFYYSKSIYTDDLFITTDQKIMIPQKANLMGLSPFCLKLDHDFLKKNVINENKVTKFKNKIERSYKNNKNNKEFIAVINELNTNKKELANCPIPDNFKNNLIDFFNNTPVSDLILIVNKYYDFIKSNSDDLIHKIIEFENSDIYDKKEKCNFYIVCTFNNKYDLLNDIFYYYCKFIKFRTKMSGTDYKLERCSFCDNQGITIPSSGSFVSENSYFFNNNSKNMINSHLKLCKTCNSYLFIAEDKLKKSLRNNIMLIPKSREYPVKTYEKFIEVLNNNESSFSKINEIMSENNIIDDFDVDFAIYTKEQGDSNPIRKYVENYRSYLVKFDNINLLNDNDSLNYLFGEKIKINEDLVKRNYFSVRNIFDIEKILKRFFVDDNLKYGIDIDYLYKFYTDGSESLKKDTNSNTKIIFYKYIDNMFDFIYNLNDNALNKNIINELVLNCLMIYIRNDYGESKNKYNNSIRERLNEYYMLIREFWRYNMLNNKSIEELKKLFKHYDNKNNEENDAKIISIVESDEYIKYYLIGQFIRYIDNFKLRNGVNAEVFYNYMTNINRNNIKKLFATEILQKNIFYINQMSKKGKLLFKIIESDLDSLFNEPDMTYEDYVLTLCTGYYTENILKSNQVIKNE